jgi:hypothetical protein
MKKKLSRKLKLSRETLSRLNGESLGGIYGGGDRTESVCDPTCPSCATCPPTCATCAGTACA